jgi:hypothetical protein
MTNARFSSLRAAACLSTIGASALVAGCSIPTAPPGSQAAAYTGTCIRPDCTPDPIPKAVDCQTAEAGLEFFNPAIVNFEFKDSNGNYVGQYMYGYVDGTANTNASAGYQPMAIPWNKCTTDTNNHVLHLTGGPFTGWGGGIGVAMEHLAQESTANNTMGLCNPSPGMPRPSYCLTPPSDPTDPNYVVQSALAFTSMDLSAYDGVAVWARRGPDSQPLLRVLVGDKFTDDDTSYEMYKGYANQTPPLAPLSIAPLLYCQRNLECDCQFQDEPCTFYSHDQLTGTTASASAYQNGASFCGAPGATPNYADMAPSGGYNNTCGTSKCDDIYPAFQESDAAFHGRPCVPYTLRNGTQASFCYRPTADANGPADPPPASGDELCGDHFTFPLHLTTDWQLYLVPFETMFQQGWAKRAPYFDTHSVSVVRLTWDAGYVDYWIDDLRFYRKKQPAPTQ